MKDIIIAAAVAVVFVIGWFIIRMLDKALASDNNENEGESLRIGINDTETGEALAQSLERFSRLYPYVRIKLVTADAQRLKKELSSRALDAVFLRADAEEERMEGIASKELMLRHIPVTMEYGGLPIESISEDILGCEVLWRADDTRPHILNFIGGLSDMQASA